jgi:subtilisin family serine protease
VLSTIGGYKPDVFVGGAFDASFILAKTEDITQEVPAEEDQYVAGLEFIEAGGADLATSSLGYIDWYSQLDLDGETAVTTIAVNTATDNGMVCVTAAGNAGHDEDPGTSTLIAPADAYEVLTCGAVDEFGAMAFFSSDGPTADGRVKPELLARGWATACIYPNDNTSYSESYGTSLSTPLVAAAAALIIDAHPDWSVTRVRSALLKTAADFVANGQPDPNFVRGHGILDVMAAINFVFPSGDFDADGDKDLADFAGQQACFTGPRSPAPVGCAAGDLDGDDDVDAADYRILQPSLTGPQ